MKNLKTTFAGLQLKNPFIVSSSGLTDSAEKNKALEVAGAAAIVLKSLFEEQIMWQTAHHLDDSYIEATDYLQTYMRAHYLEEYTRLVKESKKLCSIPIIASINCYTDKEWEDYAVTLEQAGADAVELNFMSIQTNTDYVYGSFEDRLIHIVKHVKGKIQIPVIVKLSANLTNPIKLIEQLYANGAAAIVLFNRLYQTDIDIDTLQYTTGHILSHEHELANALRWTGIASTAVPRADYAASGGITSGRDIVKSLLAGASAVEVCSAIYEKGNNIIGAMLNDVETWMAQKGHSEITQFKGLMRVADLNKTNAFERTQFMKYFGEK